MFKICCLTRILLPLPELLWSLNVCLDVAKIGSLRHFHSDIWLPITGRKIVLQHSRRTNTHTHMHFGQLFFVHLLDETQTKRK